MTTTEKVLAYVVANEDGLYPTKPSTGEPDRKTLDVCKKYKPDEKWTTFQLIRRRTLISRSEMKYSQSLVVSGGSEKSKKELLKQIEQRFPEYWDKNIAGLPLNKSV